METFNTSCTPTSAPLQTWTRDKCLRQAIQTPGQPYPTTFKYGCCSDVRAHGAAGTHSATGAAGAAMMQRPLHPAILHRRPQVQLTLVQYMHTARCSIALCSCFPLQNHFKRNSFVCTPCSKTTKSSLKPRRPQVAATTRNTLEVVNFHGHQSMFTDKGDIFVFMSTCGCLVTTR